MKVCSWGSNSHGQLGQGIEAEETLKPLKIDFECDVKSIVGGGKHSVILTTDGKLFSCGDNDQGQLARDRTLKKSLIFEPISFKIKIEKISCGWDFNLALSYEGIVYGWGGNKFGQLGLPYDKGSFVCSPIKLFKEKAIDIGAGLRHSAIVSEKGFVFCSGSGKKGQLGIICDGEKKNLSEFTLVPRITGALKISCGENHCVLSTKEGKIFTWGNNKFGQLGIDPGSRICCELPTLINRPIECSRVVTLTSGWSHNAILTDEGKVFLWGRNDFGQLGELRLECWKPKIMEALNRTIEIVLGSNHGIALKECGNIVCWGWNEHGNCGNGDCGNAYQPILLNALGYRPKHIGTGSAHSFFCAN